MKSNLHKIIVIEKDPNYNAIYKEYFKNFEEYSLIGIYTTVYEVLEKYDSLKPNIIVSEVDLLRSNGINGIAQLKRKDPYVKIIMISKNPSFELIKKAFKNGANGYLTKPLSSKRLKRALHTISSEGEIMGNAIIKQVIQNFRKKTYAFFSSRENQIVDHLCKGATYKDIAETLFVTPSAINYHIQNIYEKLNVNSKSEALYKLQQM
ncbi:LuxR family two component transcriptional regulator [Maribacter vaceletii]|uniref:LuxR family two component transcriptional regulator n=1 Tax=Maribacter vaceletii TaxID=1206816 RepID=A0A495E8N4_9FLAO|nr:response regulator transcription factor [Maribacter vaceletii]RKR13292.1 LuxR family two component transcriptional regulator [Maribacter vaceletii]